MRSLVRLQHGRLSLRESGIELTSDEVGLLARFGLALTGNHDALRLIPDQEIVAGLEQALELDTSNRRVFEPAVADAVLLRLTPHIRYQSEAQKAAVRALLTQPSGSGLLVSMPTGSGKSLLFQLAALFERRRAAGACVLVITPTIALALDHARTLRNFPGLEASRALTGDTPVQEKNLIIDAFRRGEIPILLLSPEKALSSELLPHLCEAARPDSVLFGLDARLTHLFVDEAHIIESWGRSFRPDFQRLPALLVELRNANPNIRTVLLSATIPPTARDVICKTWRLNGEWLEVDARTPRYEHDVVVASFDWPSDRDKAFEYVLDRIPRPAIVYTTQVAHANMLFARLTQDLRYARVAVFTGDTPPAERQSIIDGWAADNYDVVVATSAFGLGIDKQDVRSVVHVCLPESAARWYQEIGRAARDGGQGTAICLFTKGVRDRDSDVSQAFGLATSGWLTRELAESRWSALVFGATGKHWEAGHEIMSVNLNSLREGLPRQLTDYNRGWNMALLTLMQRAGVIRVRTVSIIRDQPGSTWDLEVLDRRIVSTTDPVAWDHVFEVREEEKAAARETLKPFVGAMLNPQRECIARSAFELIEPEAAVPPCGRCQACRTIGHRPPGILPCTGLETAWPISPDCVSPLPKEILIIAPDDPALGRHFPKLLTRLSHAGAEQFILSSELALQAARTLCACSEFGLVLEAENIGSQTKFAAVPTAVVLPDDPALASFLIGRLNEFRSISPNIPIVVVAEPHRMLGGRRLDQTLSTSAPIHEQMLDTLTKRLN
ncbi:MULTISPECIES: DEAD/DEAH box helicase [Bradyrhizobium]|uniref:DEAD/DEAH box helicase n=1 Tax=Bradyrhizobium TaxID=374 RepID=UPI000D1318C5|nr:MULTISPECIES: DEAD/DEAH box helicase [Bradyrhizobium]PSO19510.1 hypothetical protein C7G42_14760 [Bradyrhizobium sp. MOS003]QDP22722.1 ATP-dependent DNA helicase RecQ [Bradyrhizobium cosmicum]